MSPPAALRRIDETLAYLRGVAEAQLASATPDLDRLLDAYLESRRTLAKEFRELATTMMSDAHSQLAEIKHQVERRMAERFSGILPARLLEIHRYSGVHAVLLSYLVGHVSKPVSASRLRMLVGDQIHTERRVRELRDLGFDVTWKKTAGDDQYVLASADPDLDVAAKFQVVLNLRADRSIGSDQKKTWLSQAQ